MQGRSPSDAIKPEVRAASAYTLEHVAADIKLDQNENPYELPQEFKEEVARRVVARPWGRYPEFVPSAMTRRAFWPCPTPSAWCGCSATTWGKCGGVR